MAFKQDRRNYALGLALVLLGALGFSIKSITGMQVSGTVLVLAGVYVLGRSKT